jgi:hypothetical protein
MNETRVEEKRAREQESRESDMIDKTDSRSTTSTFSCSKKSEIGKLWSTVSSYETRAINHKIKLAEKLGLFQKLDRSELESLDIDENHVKRINDVIIDVLAPILKLEHVLKMDHLKDDLESWAFVNQPSQPLFVESDSQTEFETDRNTDEDRDEMKKVKEDRIKKLKKRICHMKDLLKLYREREMVCAENEKAFQVIEDDNRESISILAEDNSNLMLEVDEQLRENKHLAWRNKKLSEKLVAKEEKVCRLKRLCKEHGVQYKRRVKEAKL